MDQAASQDESGRAGLVADLEVLELHLELLGEFAQGSFRGGIADPAGPMVGGLLAGPFRGVGDGDGFFVDVEADIVRSVHGVFRYFFYVG